MFKKTTSKFITFFLVALLLFNIPATALAASNISNLKSQTQTLSEPDRKAEVEILDKKSGKLEKVIFYLTPRTNLDESSFKGLDSNFEIKGLEVEELDSIEKDDISILWVDTIFDVGNFAISLSEYYADPSFWNGFWLVMDGASVVFPGIPSISGVKRMMQDSPRLKDALKIGIKSYGTLRNQSIPSGCERHHIFEQRFASRLGTSTNNMLAIVLRKADHDLVTTKMRNKIPYTGDGYYWLTPNNIINHHIDAYYELWQQTGDAQWEYLWRFVRTGQHSVSS